ncbi:branched-chain amino acid ABC transporter permease [Halomarina rubra]|uniref:Branched-chain amino acid ABC transporter permease n=1 Tax=Halomarina rubra TaxID=2071873 RepID=A0ABD6AYS6_9EURY|nr:branched-chain amino acid ABC transporter permease [Halomarina rubra]
MAVSDRTSWGGRFLDNPAAFVAGAVAVLLLLDLVRRLVTGALGPATLMTYLWTGLVIGLIYGLAGIGLSLTYSILNFANFAHGEYVSVGAFSGWSTAYIVAGGSIATLGDLFLLRPPAGRVGVSITSAPLAVVVGLVVGVVVTVAMALVLDRIVYRPMRGAEGISLLIASIGVAFAVRYLLALVYGTGRPGVTAGTRRFFVGDTLGLGRFIVDSHQIAIIVASLGLMLGVHLLLTRTKLGKSMRAMADNEDLARVTGIPTERVIRSTWILGGGLAGAAGFLVVLTQGTIAYNIGWLLLLLIFAAVILGGIGSVYGAMVGGVVIGIAQQASSIWLRGPWSDMTLPVTFALLIVILLVRPQGIYGGVETT